MCNKGVYLVGNQSPADLSFYRVLHLRVAKAVQDSEEYALEKQGNTTSYKKQGENKYLERSHITLLRSLWDSVLKCFVHLR